MFGERKGEKREEQGILRADGRRGVWRMRMARNSIQGDLR